GNCCHKSSRRQGARSSKWYRNYQGSVQNEHGLQNRSYSYQWYHRGTLYNLLVKSIFNMRKLLIGYDIGSSSVKTTLLDADSGKVVASESLPKEEMLISSPK